VRKKNPGKSSTTGCDQKKAKKEEDNHWRIAYMLRSVSPWELDHSGGAGHQEESGAKSKVTVSQSIERGRCWPQKENAAISVALDRRTLS